MARESHNFRYDVFISFRGPDTRHQFIGYLVDQLEQKGRIRTFIDDVGLQAGDDISPALSKAIEESKVLIVVLSENYASSTWCLDELVQILKCLKRGNEQHVFPIFYYVEPWHVRHQQGKYAQAMAAHEKRFGKDSGKVRTWRSALYQVCKLSGNHVTTSSKYEIHDLQNIVEKVCVKLASKHPHVKAPVGLDQRIEEVKSRLDMKPGDDIVCMLGIYGLGGIGKTEIAEALYTKIVHNFEAASFIANVREKSNKINGLEDLQMTLLSNMFEVLETQWSSMSTGINEIKRRLGKKKVLLVLDDVDDREQLNNLAGGCDWFGPGSRIIITTRDEDLLIGHKVEKIYKMEELNDQHSLELFCQHAFEKNRPKKGYEEVSSRAVSCAKGLPLALKVIGSDLFTERSKEGVLKLEEYKNKMTPNKSIQDVLKIIYERLEPKAKEVFLDIACFFKGETRQYVENILNELYAGPNIEVLINKSLLTIEDGCLNMHDLLQDMGREIVRKEGPNNPGKRSRLWSHEDVIKVLTEDLGSDAIEGIMLNPCQRKEVEWSGTAFKKMGRLRILIVRNTSFSTEPGHLPNHLRLLDWEEYPSESFPPKNYHPKDIIVFNLCRSNLILEGSFQKFSSLTTMNFSHNQSITEMPDVWENPNLREIRLDNCNNLTKIHRSVGYLHELAHFSASGCTKLKDFPEKMDSTSLEVIDLNSCTSLEHFPQIVSTTTEPLKIYMRNTAIEKLPDSVSKLIGLVCLDMSESRKLNHLPPSLFLLPNVETFKFGGCSNLGAHSFRQSNATSSTLKTLHIGNSGLSGSEDLDAILKCFPELEELIAPQNKFESLPACIEKSHLTSLDVSDCKKLGKIRKCTNLRILNVDGCVELKEISKLPSTIQKVDARYCRSLTAGTLDMLWSQVKKEIQRLEVVMPQTEIPDWFNLKGNGGNPCFWARRKFPIVALALVFNNEKGTGGESHQHEHVELHLVINGQRVTRSRGYYNFRMEADHVLVCDLQLLFNEEEWMSLDAFLVHDWNQVQVSFKAPPTMILSSWGVFVYKKGTNMEDVRFMCPVDRPIMTGIFWNGIMDGLVEAQKKFPSLDIHITLLAAYTRFEGTALPEFEVRISEPEVKKMYREGILSGLNEAKLSFPTLDAYVEAILNDVLSMGAHKGTAEAPDAMPSTVPNDDNTYKYSSDLISTQAREDSTVSPSTLQMVIDNLQTFMVKMHEESRLRFDNVDARMKTLEDLVRNRR